MVVTLSGITIDARDAYPRNEPSPMVVTGRDAIWNHNRCEGCASLTSTVIPESVATIGKDVFLGCTSLTVSDQPATRITRQSDIMVTYTYDGNTSLGKVPRDVESVIIDSSVIEIRGNAFR
jgi:hypothetical protein